MDKLEFEQWPHMTRFKNWKTSFRREVITGTTHLRQATDWSAEFDQATSMQDLGDVGSVFGSTGMSFEALDSQIAKGLMKIMNPEFKRKFRWPKNYKRRQIAFMILDYSEINDMQGKATNVKDLFMKELINGALKKFDQAWEEETFMALEKEPEADLLEGLFHRQLQKSTLMLNDLAKNHPQSTEELLEFESSGLRRFRRRAATFSNRSRRKRLGVR